MKRIPNKLLPDYLKGISPEPDERAEYEDAMSNMMRLVEYLRLNEDVLSSYDYRVMMRVELDRQPPRLDILLRLKGKINRERHKEETLYLTYLVGQARGE